MTVDSLFPAFAVVAPYFFGAECRPEPALPDWADGVNYAVIALQQAEPIFRILALAGWRPTKLRYWHSAVGNTSATRQWCVIELAERDCSFETWTPTTVIRTTEFGDLCLAVECEEITDGAERHHGFALPSDPDHDGESQNWRWYVDLRPEGTKQLIFVTQPRHISDAGGPPVSQEAAYFAHKRQKLDDGIDRFVGLLGSALVAGARDRANLPGLTWLLLPQHWFVTAEDLAEEDLFVDQIRKSAERVTEAFAQGAGLDTLVRMIAFPQACSLNELGRKVDPIFKNRSDTAAKAELQLTRKATQQETSPLKDAVEGSCYFDMLCMMIPHRADQPALDLCDRYSGQLGRSERAGRGGAGAFGGMEHMGRRRDADAASVRCPGGASVSDQPPVRQHDDAEGLGECHMGIQRSATGRQTCDRPDARAWCACGAGWSGRAVAVRYFPCPKPVGFSLADPARGRSRAGARDRSRRADTL